MMSSQRDSNKEREDEKKWLQSSWLLIGRIEEKKREKEREREREREEEEEDEEEEEEKRERGDFNMYIRL